MILSPCPKEMLKRPSESEKIEASEKVYQEHLAQKKEAADKENKRTASKDCNDGARQEETGLLKE